MAHWQLGRKDQARHWYEQAETYRAQHPLGYVDTRRIADEAKQLMGIAAGPPRAHPEDAETETAD